MISATQEKGNDDRSNEDNDDENKPKMDDDGDITTQNEHCYEDEASHMT